MPILKDTRRWLVDRFSEPDEMISGSPKRPIREAEVSVLNMTAAERTQTIKHLKAYSDLYYQGRHNEAVPDEVKSDLRTPEKRVERLNTVDAAREIVAKLGGPPTHQTIQDSLDRSYKERAKEFSASVARQPSQDRVKVNDVAHEYSAGM